MVVLALLSVVVDGVREGCGSFFACGSLFLRWFLKGTCHLLGRVWAARPHSTGLSLIGKFPFSNRGDESRENGKMNHRETNKLSVLCIRVSRVEWQPGPVRLPELRLFSVRLCPADRRYQFLHPASWSATRQQERRGLCWTQTALAASPAQDPRPDLGFLPITCGRAASPAPRPTPQLGSGLLFHFF